jgi:hypothetical protein
VRANAENFKRGDVALEDMNPFDVKQDRKVCGCTTTSKERGVN